VLASFPTRSLGRKTSPTGPSTRSTWNKIEHRPASFITHNWRGKLLVTLEVIINLIAATSSRAGLEVCAQLDRRTYPNQGQSTRRRTRRRPDQRRLLPSRVELHHQTLHLNIHSPQAAQLLA
jgi:hypothetical protein